MSTYGKLGKTSSGKSVVVPPSSMTNAAARFLDNKHNDYSSGQHRDAFQSAAQQHMATTQGWSAKDHAEASKLYADHAKQLASVPHLAVAAKQLAEAHAGMAGAGPTLTGPSGGQYRIGKSGGKVYVKKG